MDLRREVSVVCVCVHSLPPPLVFIGGSHWLRLTKPTLGTYEEATRGLVEAVGPMGLVVRWPRGANRTQHHPAGCPGPPCLVYVGLGLSWLI